MQFARKVIDNIFAFVGILDVDGVLIEANRAPLEAAKLVASDVKGKKFWECYWWNYSDEVMQQIQDAVKKAAGGEMVRFDTQVRVAGGALIWIDFHLAPLRDSDNRIINLVPSGIDITERVNATEALNKSYETLRHLVDHSPFGLYIVDADFQLAQVSDGARKAFANADPLFDRDFAEVLRILWPEPFASQAIGHFRHCLATGEPYHSPSTVEQRQDTDELDSYDWKIERINMPDGRFGVVCHFYDLTERLMYEEQIKFLMREVHHRSKNLLTVVMSLARQTARHTAPENFIDQFEKRISGLSLTHDLVVETNAQGVSIDALVKSQLYLFGEKIPHDRIQVNGDDILLKAEAAQGIGMALHELCTNALKYGALSNLNGLIVLEWKIQRSDDENTFQINWMERGGPAVLQPEKYGLGHAIIGKMAASSVGGHVEQTYLSQGLLWTLYAPVDEVVVT